MLDNTAKKIIDLTGFFKKKEFQFELKKKAKFLLLILVRIL